MALMLFLFFHTEIQIYYVNYWKELRKMYERTFAKNEEKLLETS